VASLPIPQWFKQLLSKGKKVDDPSALITAGMLPWGRAAVSVILHSDGPVSIDMTNGIPGFVLLELDANCTGLTFDNVPLWGTIDHFSVLTLQVLQSNALGGPFTWAPPSGISWVGGDSGTATTTPGNSDIYTFVYNGSGFTEIARSMGVVPPSGGGV
jgi:hypothetical protein